MREQPLGTAGGIVILLLVLVSIFADSLAPYRYEEIHLRDRLQAPTAAYLLGTDHVGRDLLSRLIHGARLSLTVGLAATVLTVVVAVLIGGTTGFIGGRLDLVTQRFVDAWMAFPGLLLLLTIMSIAGRGMLQIIVVLGVSGGIPASRVVRGAVLGVKENAYFQAAQAIGSSRRRSLLRHVLPNIAAPIIIIFSINVGGVIMSEAALSFLGFGLPPDIPSWGGMLSRGGAPVHGDGAAPGAVAGAVPDRESSTASTCSATPCATSWTPACAAASAATAPAGSRTTNAHSHGAAPGATRQRRFPAPRRGCIPQYGSTSVGVA